MGLDNDAFRQFVNDVAIPSQKKPKQKKSKPSTKPGIGRGGKPGPKEDEDEPKYRDRADERRRGITVEESAPSYLTAEETRYLGGSMERTHLVRGLDRLLLDQVRHKAEGSEQDVPAPGAAEPDSHTEPDQKPVTFHTALGRTVGTYLLQPPSSNIAELFQPKRMAFVYFADNKGSDDEEEEADDDDEQEGDGVAGKTKKLWGPNVEEESTKRIPETLLRSKAECPAPPDALNAAIDKPVLTEVIGVMRAVHVESRHRGKDKKRMKEDAVMSLAEAQQQKEQHVLQLRKFENPKLVAELAARDAAAEKAQRASEAAPAKAPKSAKPTTRTKDGDEDSDGSGLFDDVGDDYEVDTSKMKEKQRAKRDQKGRLFSGDAMHGLPAVAQHGDSHGNEAADARSGGPGVDRQAQYPSGHGYPPPRPGYPPARPPNRSQQQQQYHGYPPGQPQGYYDHYGNWVQNGAAGPGAPYTRHGAQDGYDGAPYVSAADLAAQQQQQQQQAEEAAGKGKGFAAKMGDRAVVKSAFSTEQRQAKVGKGVVEGGDDEYGADILVGGGGLDYEEEEDLKAMESRGRTLTRDDFHTDEQFQAYKASKEAAPKAAFQFGVKVQDGRRSHKDMEKASNKKLDSQLRSIRDMKGNVGGRKVDFGKFDGAFGGSSKGGEVAATPARKRIKL